MTMRQLWELGRRLQMDDLLLASPRPRLYAPTRDDYKPDCRWCKLSEHSECPIERFLEIHPVYKLTVTLILLQQ